MVLGCFWPWCCKGAGCAVCPNVNINTVIRVDVSNGSPSPGSPPATYFLPWQGNGCGFDLPKVNGWQDIFFGFGKVIYPTSKEAINVLQFTKDLFHYTDYALSTDLNSAPQCNGTMTLNKVQDTMTGAFMPDTITVTVIGG